MVRFSAPQSFLEPLGCLNAMQSSLLFSFSSELKCAHYLSSSRPYTCLHAVACALYSPGGQNGTLRLLGIPCVPRPRHEDGAQGRPAFDLRHCEGQAPLLPAPEAFQAHVDPGQCTRSCVVLLSFTKRLNLQPRLLEYSLRAQQFN